MGLVTNRIVHTLFAAFLALTTAQADTTLSNDELTALLNTLEKKLSGLTTMRAEFKQDKHIALFDETLTAKGRLLFKTPGRIRFEISEPFKSILIVADKEVGKYENSKTGWKKLQLKNADALALVMKQIGDWMNGKFRSQSRIFGLAAETRDNGKTYLILKSKPKQFAKIIEQIEIELSADRSQFNSITIRERGGDNTVLTFEREIRNVTFEEGVFDVTRKRPVELTDVVTK